MIYKHIQGLIPFRIPYSSHISAKIGKHLKSSGKDTKIWRVAGNYFCADFCPEINGLNDGRMA